MLSVGLVHSTLDEAAVGRKQQKKRLNNLCAHSMDLLSAPLSHIPVNTISSLLTPRMSILPLKCPSRTAQMFNPSHFQNSPLASPPIRNSPWSLQPLWTFSLSPYRAYT